MYHVKFDDQSNAADWVDNWLMLDETGEPANIYDDGWQITVKISAMKQPANHASRHGAEASPHALLTASTADGTVTINAQSAIEWRFTAAQMSGLPHGAYSVGCLATKAGQTVQIFIGVLPVIQGI